MRPFKAPTRRKLARERRRANFYRRFRGTLRVAIAPVTLASGNTYVKCAARGRGAVWFPTSYDTWTVATARCAGYRV